jgi:hypothetical protein
MFSKTLFILAAAFSGSLAVPAIKTRSTPYTNLDWTVSNFAIAGNEGNFFSFNITDGPGTPTFKTHCELQTLEGVSFQNVTCSDGNGDIWFSFDYPSTTLSVLHAIKSDPSVQIAPYNFYEASIQDDGSKVNFVMTAKQVGLIH